MKNEELDNTIEQQDEESSVDFIKLFRLLTNSKRLYLWVLGITFVLACIIQLSIPKYYRCDVILSPEMSSGGRLGSMGSLANMIGYNISASGSSDAIGPLLYPDLMNTTDFKLRLFPVKVHKKDSTRVMTYYDYLCNEQKSPWWTEAIVGSLEFVLSPLMKKEEEKPLNPFELTKRQVNILKLIDKRIVCDVDNKSYVITISVTDQDPLVAALMADSVKQQLQDFITEYRTKKARHDLEYTRKLYDEVKGKYIQARENYAKYADANQGLIWESSRIRLTELENDMQLLFNNYNSLSMQLQAAEAKVQQDTPAFTTLQSATIPVKKAGPRRMRNVFIFLFLAFAGTSIYILHKEGELLPLLGIKQ